MIQLRIYIILFIAFLVVFNSCEKGIEKPDFAQPIVELSSKKETVNVNGTDITTGAEKDFEQDSYVIYKLKVNSPNKKLSRLIVTSSSDAISQNSEILQTVPANAINANGEFTQRLNEVDVYYKYQIHALVSPKSQETVTFTLQDENNNAGFVNTTHTVIKRGSSNGKLLKEINLQYFNKTFSLGIGSQDNLQRGEVGIKRPDRSTRDCRGPFFSLSNSFDYTHMEDAIKDTEIIDLVGYRTLVASKNPTVANNTYILTSLSDSLFLYSAYDGYTHAQIQIQGTEGSVDITVGGLTRTATFRTNLNTTAQDFETAYKQEYADIGYTLTRSNAKLIWTINKSFPDNLHAPPVITNITGNLIGVEQDSRNIEKNRFMRECAREMAQKMRNEGKVLQKVKFKRLDNIDGQGKLTKEEFDLLTHDNEFDELLGDIWENGEDRATGVLLNQVWGFVINDGKRGIVRTSNSEVADINDVLVTVPAPNASNINMYGVIKVSMP